LPLRDDPPGCRTLVHALPVRRAGGEGEAAPDGPAVLHRADTGLLEATCLEGPGPPRPAGQPVLRPAGRAGAAPLPRRRCRTGRHRPGATARPEAVTHGNERPLCLLLRAQPDSPPGAPARQPDPQLLLHRLRPGLVPT